MGWGFAAGVGLSLLSSLLSSGKKSQTTEMEPINVRMADGTVVKMHRLTGKTAYSDGSTTGSTIAGALADGASAYGQGQAARNSGKIASDFSTSKNTLGGGAGMEGMKLTGDPSLNSARNALNSNPSSDPLFDLYK